MRELATSDLSVALAIVLPRLRGLLGGAGFAEGERVAAPPIEALCTCLAAVCAVAVSSWAETKVVTVLAGVYCCAMPLPVAARAVTVMAFDPEATTLDAMAGLTAATIAGFVAAMLMAMVEALAANATAAGAATAIARVVLAEAADNPTAIGSRLITRVTHGVRRLRLCLYVTVLTPRLVFFTRVITTSFWVADTATLDEVVNDIE